MGPMAPSNTLTVDIPRGSAEFAEYLHEAGKTVEQFQREVVERIAAFCQEHAEIAKGLLFMPSGVMSAIVGTHDVAYDFELATDVAQLDIELAGQGWQVTTAELPGATLDEQLRHFGQFVADDDD
jgi:hypothetical protein